jgi:hypothetical protein
MTVRVAKMFLSNADFASMPQFADCLHRRTNEAVNYFRQPLAFQMRGDKNIGYRSSPPSI